MDLAGLRFKLYNMQKKKEVWVFSEFNETFIRCEYNQFNFIPFQFKIFLII